MNQLVNPEYIPAQARNLTPEAVRERVNLIQKVMKSVMKDGVHYGIIPGCEKPSLWKPGSEVLLTTFQISIGVRVEDLSNDDCFRYRVYVTGTDQISGVVIGEGIGECSTDEEKYKWKRCYDKREFEATPETRRKIKYGNYQGKPYENMMVRTEPADLANTVLKMGKKRGQIDFTLTALGASDIFTQDIEDLPEGVLDEEKTKAEKEAKQKQDHNTAFVFHYKTVIAIKEAIESDDNKLVAEKWRSIPEQDQRSLWLATTKGGIFTTSEREYIKTKLPKPEPELSDADREILQGAKQQ